MKANKKKIIVLVAMITLLVATGCLNYFLNVKDAEDVNADTNVPTFFEVYRADRTTTRTQEIQYLDEMIASASSSEETIANAQAQKLALTTAMETELVLESLIKAYGFGDCVVTISTNNVNIVVKDEELTTEEAAQILNIVVQETDYVAADVVIIPYV
jgi:stage III sporulation protein AH